MLKMQESTFLNIGYVSVSLFEQFIIKNDRSAFESFGTG